MKTRFLPAFAAAAALCAASAAQDAASAADARFASLPPHEREHALRMIQYRAARDAAERDIIRIKGAVEARRAAILETNEEAKALFEDAERLFAEYSAKTNALQGIMEGDEKIAALLEDLAPALAIVEAKQSAMNAEVVASMRERMQRQREAAAAAEAEAAADSSSTPSISTSDAQ